MKTAPSSSLEILENRIAPAGLVSVDIVNGVLTIDGDTDDNVVALSVLAPGFFKIEGTNTSLRLNSAQPAASFTFDNPFTSIVINGHEGSDYFSLNGLILARTLTFDGGDGDDALNLEGVQIRGATKLLGGANDDTFTFTGNSNRFALLHLEGGDGADTVNLEGTLLKATGKVEILGGPGIDAINGTSELFAAPSLLVDAGTEDSTVALTFGQAIVPGAVKLVQGEHAGRTNMTLGAAKLEIGSLLVDLKGATNIVSFFASSTDVLLVKGAVTVNGGAGADSFTLGGASVSTGALKFTGGDGSNTLQVDPGLGSLQAASVTYTGGINTDNITFEGVEVRIKGAFNLVLGGGVSPSFDDNFVTVDSGSFTAGSVRVSGGAGDPTVVGSNDTVKFTPDRLTVKGGLTASLGAGDDQVEISADRVDLGAVTLTLGESLGFSAVTTLNSSTGSIGAVKITTSAGGSSVAFNSTAVTVKSFTYTGADGDDTLALSGLHAGAVTANLGDGPNSFTLSGLDNELASLTVQGGPDEDTVSVTGTFAITGLTNLMLGAGNSSVDFTGDAGTLGGLLQGGLKLVTKGAAADNDTFVARNVAVGRATNLTFGDSDSTVTIDNFNALGAFNLLTGGGVDIVNIERDATAVGISRLLGRATIDLGAGDDKVAIGRNSADESVKGIALIIKGGADTDTLSNLIDDDNQITVFTVIGVENL